jgi:hypothetical protein
MTVQTFYRCAVWLPLVVPALVAVAVHVVGLQPSSPAVAGLVQLLLISLLYGGFPYAVLAAYGTWWIDGRPESQIRHRALRAPLWMLAAWLPFAAFLGVASRRVEIFLGLAGLGAIVIFPLGYAYIALVFLLRRWLDRSEWLATSPSGHVTGH